MAVGRGCFPNRICTIVCGAAGTLAAALVEPWHGPVCQQGTTGFAVRGEWLPGRAAQS